MGELKSEIEKNVDVILMKLEHINGRISETNAGINNFKTEVMIRMDTIDKRGCEKGDDNLKIVKEKMDANMKDLHSRINCQSDRINSQRNVFVGAGIIGTIIASVVAWFKN